eukprot:TRINITY_DN2950_c2_g1_i3.p1 TRINITY_DN2950_c2_g1~~TRINITY_DN2950_c2_g1_i3.p1  ORF type:complete len:364 (+),score=39.88 TRINITY_DN2950_c2_g1_i3:52-1143(+)
MMFPRAAAELLLALVLGGSAVYLQGCDWFTDHEEASTTPPRSPPSSSRLGSFLVIGDWGWHPQVHGNLKSRTCQQAIADAMASKAKELGDVQFIINVGDSFYPNGVENRSDPLWDSQWRNVYAPALRSKPWYSVHGNHDYIGDPCLCADPDSWADCAQINRNSDDLNYFFMPNYSYTVERPDLQLEVIALDLNYYAWVNQTCKYTSCYKTCEFNLKKRSDAALELLSTRFATSASKHWVVFSHYPTDYFPSARWEVSNRTVNLWDPAWTQMTPSAVPADLHSLLGRLSKNSRQVEYFGGHRHNVDQSSTTSIAPNNNWLVGGGGGWGTDGEQQGFVVGEIAADGSIKSYSVLVNFTQFCSPTS